MSWVVKFAKSSIGAKMVMALTGFGLVLFVAQHLVSNLLVFAGQDTYNAYAFNIKNTAWLLWGGRSGILVAFVLHVASGIRLAALNKAARPVSYAKKKPVRSTFASRTMAFSGLTLLGLIAYHLAHFTFGFTNPGDFGLHDPLGRHDAYSMMILGFQNPIISFAYVVFMVLVGLHTAHGVSSMFQSLGLNSAKYRSLIAKIGPVFAVVIVLGFLSIPAAALLGVLKLPAGVAP